MKKLFALAALACTLFAAQAPQTHSARITETMDAGGYTYMKVAEGKDAYWVAVTATPVKVGQQVSYNEQMWMPNFKSRALDRTFDNILFATMAYAPSAQQQMERVQPRQAPKTVLAKAEGGYSVAEVFEKREALKGKQIRVRGKVTKVSRGIMKRDWVHLEDGTGDEVTDDLVFTAASAAEVQPGNIVIATGTVITDKDFGFGYFYPVIIENSTFEKEK